MINIEGVACTTKICCRHVVETKGIVFTTGGSAVHRLGPTEHTLPDRKLCHHLIEVGVSWLWFIWCSMGGSAGSNVAPVTCDVDCPDQD